MFKEAFKRYVFRKFHVSFSTSGEDVLLQKLLSRHVQSRFYVDIGAYHPVRFSNSYFFYLRGWRGICVDANPRAISYFQKHRPRDICINKGLSDGKSVLKYYNLADRHATMSSFDYELIEKEGLVTQIREVIEIECVTLEDLLDHSLPTPSPHIDFLSLDVEGYDTKVLRGNNWKKYRPTVICVETRDFLKDCLNNEVASFLDGKGYELIGKTLTTHTLGNLIFMDRAAYS